VRKTLRRFVGLKTLADNGEAQAAKRLAASLARLEAKQAELDRLNGYADGYEREHRDRSSDAARLSNFSVFTTQLSSAIAQLEQEVAAALDAFRADLEHWRSGYRRSKGLEQLVAQYRDALARHEAKREQKELDEQVARRSGPTR
jgi:flagellar export protein FliJ